MTIKEEVQTVFRATLGVAGKLGSAWYFYWPGVKISPVKCKHRRAVNLKPPLFPAPHPPHLPFNSRCLVLGVVTRLAAFISALTCSSVCFPKLVWPTVIRKETFISCGISDRKLRCFSLRVWRTETSFYEPLHTRPHFTNLCELRVWPLVFLEMPDARLCITITASSLLKENANLGTTVAHRSALSSSFLLSLNSKPDGPYVHDVHGFLR